MMKAAIKFRLDDATYEFGAELSEEDARNLLEATNEENRRALTPTITPTSGVNITLHRKYGQ